MSNVAVWIAAAVLFANALTACEKSDGVKTAVTPPQPAVADSHPHATVPEAVPDHAAMPEVAALPDHAAASRRLAAGKPANDAARCGVVFATARSLASQSGDSKGSALMDRAVRVTQYVVDVAVSDRHQPAQTFGNIRASTTHEAESWTQQQLETYMAGCTKQFVDLAPVLAQAGLVR